MYLETSDRGCPHLREQTLAEARQVAVAEPPRPSCPGAQAREAEAPRRVPTVTRAMGWWAFASEARSMEATV